MPFRMTGLFSLRIILILYISILGVHLLEAAFKCICLQELHFIELIDSLRKYLMTHYSAMFSPELMWQFYLLLWS